MTFTILIILGYRCRHENKINLNAQKIPNILGAYFTDVITSLFLKKSNFILVSILSVLLPKSAPGWSSI